MGRLRHQEFPSATYFVTTKCWQNISIFQVIQSAEILITKMLEYRDKGNYLLHEFVVIPNHLHILVTPGSSTSLERAMQLIKGGSSHEIHKVRGTTAIWQSGFHESRIRDAGDYKSKRDYICFNPVTSKLADRPQDWQFGSASGIYRLDPVPQRLKPANEQSLNVGAKAPTPSTESQITRNEAKAPSPVGPMRGLKPLPPKEEASTINRHVLGKNGA